MVAGRIAAGLCLAVAASALVAPWWWPSSAALHWAPQAAVVTLAVVLWTRRDGPWGIAAVCAFVMFATPTMLAAWAPRAPIADHGARLVVANVAWWNGDRHAAIAADLASQDPDLLLLIEASQPLIDECARRLPDHFQAGYLSGSYGAANLALLSRWPVHDAEVLPVGPSGSGLLMVTVELEGHPLCLVAFHPFAPVDGPRFTEWAAAIDGLAATIQRAGPLVVAGDFNCAPWHPRMLALLAQGVHLPAGPIPRTWPAWAGPAGIPIDHVLAGPGVALGRARSLELDGSDHRGVAVTVALAERP